MLALAAGLVFAAGAGASSPSPSAAAGGERHLLKVGWDTEPDNLNPFVGYEQSSYELFHVEYDFLTDYSPAHLETEPGLATSWTHSPDGLTWTFTIRSGVKWQDGVPLTAHDVAFTYTFMMKYKLQAFLASLQAIKTVTAPNDTTVVITCTRPKADILSMWVPILPQHIWGRFHSYTRPTTSPTSRPSWAPARSRSRSGCTDSTCSAWPTRATGAGLPRSTSSSSASTPTRRRWPAT